ncbi:hypothetical protein [Mycobacteroides chelonae]|uniref:hypothetical protein n=1 Tax=Mycobacteroides chelonae TaxID=1774 RepID=UPI003AAB9832
MTDQAGIGHAVLALGSLLLAASLVTGCVVSPEQRPAEVTNTSVAVTATNPALEMHKQLREIELRSPERIPDSMRTRFPWAFDLQTGRLVDYDKALVRAQGYDGCASACVQASYTEILNTTMVAR